MQNQAVIGDVNTRLRVSGHGRRQRFLALLATNSQVLVGPAELFPQRGPADRGRLVESVQPVSKPDIRSEADTAVS